MTLPIFHRQAWGQFWLTISSSESLGILDSDYLEDYDGTDGQLSLHLQGGARYPLLMGEIAAPAPHEVFRGWIALALLPDGDYAIEGRVRDVIGNYTILSAVASPNGTEAVLPMAFTIASGSGYTAVSLGPVSLRGTALLTAMLPAPRLRAVAVQPTTLVASRARGGFRADRTNAPALFVRF